MLEDEAASPLANSAIQAMATSTVNGHSGRQRNIVRTLITFRTQHPQLASSGNEKADAADPDRRCWRRCLKLGCRVSTRRRKHAYRLERDRNRAGVERAFPPQRINGTGGVERVPKAGGADVRAVWIVQRMDPEE